MAKTRQVWPRRIRRIVQTLAFVLFLAFIVGIAAMAGRRARSDLLMRFSPLSGLGASISSWELMTQFWPAAVLLLAAVLLGRFFCGWLCPLGAALDVGDRIIGFLRGRRRSRELNALDAPEGAPDFEHLRGRRFKYYLLTACLVGAFLGVSFFGLFDPLSIAVRSFVLVVHSYIAQGLLSLLGAFGWSAGGSAVRRALAVRTAPVFQLHVVTLIVLLGLLGLGLVRRRFWCRYLCPLGALYALAARPAVTKRSVSDACIECGQCVRACPMGCISPDGRATLNGECTLCLQCQAVCPTSAVRFFAATPAQQKAEVDLTRRGVVAAVASGLVAHPLLRTRRAWLHAKDDPLIRPPLAGSDAEAFLSKCLRCGQCMRVCPTQVIQPAGVEAGIESLWTPKLAPRPGYCEYNCDLCGRACPSGAIPRFDLEAKHKTAVGLAYLDRLRCIPWRGHQRRDEAGFVADDYNCGVCEEVCPVPGKAIHFRRIYGRGSGGGEGLGRGRMPDRSQELRLPYVRQEACVGCGYCEAVCPVVGKVAVRVTGGFRELPPQQVAAAEPPLAETALPAVAGALRLVGPKTTYTGPQELFDYINGGADPYLTFGFIRVTTADYTDGENKVKVDLWEFETGDDAYGAFAKDRQGEPAEVGDEGAVVGGSLWARRGRFMLSIIDLDAAPADQVRLLADAVLKALGEAPAPRPAICRSLPAEGLDPMSVVFMRDERPLYDVYLADRFIPDETWDFSGGAVGAYGVYPVLRDDGKPAGLILIRHADAQDAEEAAARLANLRTGWAEEQVAREPYAVFQAGEGNYCAIASRAERFAAAFFAPSPEAAQHLLRSALGQ